MKLDILAIVAHPDDAELGCSGTLLKAVAEGKKVGIVDLTQGEMGTRGTPQTRMQEAAEAARILGLSARENLGFADVFFTNDTAHQLQVVRMLRKYQPSIVIANAPDDRHPDHGKAARLVVEAAFLSGLPKISTQEGGKEQHPWRPKQIFHMIQARYLQPDFVIDVTPYWEQRMASVMAYRTQFFTNSTESSEGPQTFISTPQFLQFLEARARELGQHVGATYAEGFVKSAPFQVRSLLDLI